MPKVLIVEDDPSTRALLKALIQTMGCEVDEAGDGLQALEKLGEEDYSVILLDIVLPKLSGTAVMDRLHEVDPGKLERVIVVTGLNVDDIRKLFPTVCHALTKPVMPKRLQDSISKCLRTNVDGHAMLH